MWEVVWDKTDGILQEDFRSCLLADALLTKRKMLGIVNGVFHVLGLASSVMIAAKILFSKRGLKRISWDENIPQDV